MVNKEEEKKTSLLDALWTGELQPEKIPLQQYRGNGKLIEQLSQSEKALLEDLTSEQAALFEQFMSHYMQLQEINGKERFSSGFRLGVRLMAEAFEA